MQRYFLLFLLFLLTIALGCDSDQADAPGTSTADPAATAEDQGIKRVDSKGLPELGNPLPVLEEGTLRIAPTVNMDVLSRRSSYICGFYFVEKTSPPRLLLTSEPNPFPSISSVTEANLEEFAKLTQERLVENDTKPLEVVLPMIIGGKPCVRYVLAARFNEADAERQILETIKNGKLYRLDLQVFRRHLTTYRDDAYAVFAGMEIESTGSPAETATADEATPAEPEPTTEEPETQSPET